MTDRIPGAPGRCKAVVTGEELQKLRAGEEFAITLRRDDQPLKVGTPYSKASVLPDELAASLCPGIQDPAPKDAFAALHTRKADTIRRGAGKCITLQDAAHTPLMGLKLVGAGSEGNCVGDSGSVTVTVTGKNLVDYRKAIPRGSGATEFVEIDEENECIYWTGTYYFYIPLPCVIPAGTTLRLSHKSECEANPDNTAGSWHVIYEDGTQEYCDISRPLTISKNVNMIWIRRQQTDSRDIIKIWDIQLEVGTVITEYEPYREAQTLTVPTAAGEQIGLEGNDQVRDEIDFARGVLIHRVSEDKEYPLSEEVSEAYAKLHTNAPTTTIINDAGADMELTYYTSSTAVQMVHSSADKGKTFTVDEHGCVTLTKDNPVIACGYATIDRNEWYYRKWADGFGECWVSFSEHAEYVFETESGRTLVAQLMFPFSFWLDAPTVHLTFRDAIINMDNLVGTRHIVDIVTGRDSVSLTITETGELVDTSYNNVNGMIYVAGRWKAPEGYEE